MSGKRGQSGEDRMIERFFRPLARHPGALELRDDAALLSPPAGHDLVVTADTTVAGVHFFADDPPETIGKKALRVNLSDLAAKGAAPLGALLAISLPGNADERWIERFAEGLGEDCAAFSCPLLGGDTTKTPGPLSISITAIGTVPAGGMVKRSGARPGDLVVVSGTIGDAALGLLARKRSFGGGFAALDAAQRGELSARYLLPEPRLALADALRAHAGAAMDISDGLVGDLAKLAAVSGVGAAIETRRLPLSNPAHDAIASEPDLLTAALTGGDDYEILAAVPEGRFAAFAERAGAAGVPVAAIGRFTGEAGITVTGEGGIQLSFDQRSYSHF